MKARHAKLIKRSALAGLMGAACAASISANAAVLFDPDGAGGTGPISVGNLDWGPTSFAAVGSITAIQNWASSGGACAGTSCDFTVYTHARLATINDPNGNPIIPPGLNNLPNGYEITLVLSITERVTGVTGNVANFATLPNSSSFLQIYYDTTIDSDALTGSGYNDGRLILTGSGVQPNQQGSFTAVPVTPPAVPPALDNTIDGDQYPGQFTVSGFGTQLAFGMTNLQTDPTFFITQLGAFGVQFANISQQLPFNSVNPSDCFTVTPNAGAPGTVFAPSGCDTAHVNGPFSAQGPAPAGGYVPVIGLVNGTIPGPDFVAQTDFNSPLSAPEPGSLALLGLGLGGLGLMGKRRRSV